MIRAARLSFRTEPMTEAARRQRRRASPQERLVAAVHALGPGVVSGAADDDPSGIATYSQAGAQFGFGLLWTALLTTPFMIAIQLAAARVGRVTGRGLAGNLRAHWPRHWVIVLVGLLVVANTVNITADIVAMGEAVRLLVGGTQRGYSLLIGIVVAALQVALPYWRLAAIFNWLSLTLLAYVAVLFTVHVDWAGALSALFLPHLTYGFESMMMVVAVLGTTISPYLFFWQASQEVEEMRRRGKRPLLEYPEKAPGALLRIRLDTIAGMVFSNVIALAIMLAAASTLHSAGQTDIQTATQAAEALRPLAGQSAFLLFAAGIITTGLLAVPVLAGSAAYAVSETFGWGGGLDHTWKEARGFYAIIVGCTVGGVALDFTPIDPIRALIFSAVVNGVAAVPIMAMLMAIASRPMVMGEFVLRGPMRLLGWTGTALMAVAVGLMFYGLARS
jgi:NRAMP (natural resistance-associated macrophage protein)-like metal ion transporter